MSVWWIHSKLGDNIFSLPPSETGGEAGPAHQEARQAGSGWRQPGPKWRQRVAQTPPYERNHSTSSTLCLSAVSQATPSTHPSAWERAFCWTVLQSILSQCFSFSPFFSFFFPFSLTFPVFLACAWFMFIPPLMYVCLNSCPVCYWLHC